MIKWGILGIGAVLALTACQSREDRLAFDGQFFNARLSKVDRQRDQFEVNVRPFSASSVGARAAGEYEAIRYCIEQYGSSDIIWERGPDAEDGVVVVSGDTLNMRGACAPL